MSASTFELRPLGELCQRTAVWSPEKEPRSKITYVDVSAVSSERLRIVQPQKLKASEAPSRARKIVQTSDTIFATIRPTLTRIALVTPDLDGELASTAFCVIRPRTDVLLPEFAYFAVQTDEFVQAVARHERGASYPAVRDKDVLGESIPLPSLAEQRKIAAVLGKVQAAVEVEGDLIRVTRELKQAALRQLFTRGLRGEPQKETEIGPVPENWDVIKTGDVCNLSSGGTPDRGNPAFWKDGTIPWVKTGEVTYRVVADTEERITPLGLKSSAAKLLPAGTLVMAMYGQGITRGRVARLGIEATTNQACAAITPKADSRLSSDFLYHYFVFAYEYLRSLGHGANQKNMNLEIIRQVSVPRPSGGEQREIAALLQTIDAKLAHHEARQKLLRELFRTLLRDLLTARRRVTGLNLSAITS